ncbi:MAG: cyclic pyranopterin monophosphate synthase MoaC [Calditrichaeota bacterium]|nr:cyclic pyranopterin monophosphate synthase MoaC [Calditrichota bacterium]MBT7789700.1 cyclic pyranopterin monophosphate synthase MoaC [Calditrichota bacterium]
MNKISHLDKDGSIRMVDVGEKNPTKRLATAEGYVIVGSDIINLIKDGRAPKGNVLETARLAGIMAAKRTSELIPLCHMLNLDHVQVDFELESDRIRVESSVATRSVTGVEMEALTAVSVAALTIYDMLKALSHGIEIKSIRLLTKSGGKSGDYKA